MHDDDERETSPVVVGAVSIGTAPLPFLAVYAVLFILRGTIRPVHPPDVTSSQTGELIAGIVALIAFVVMSTTLLWFLNRRRRWPFAAGQLAMVAITTYFLLDRTTGGEMVSALVLVTSVMALVLGFAPASWRHVERPVPRAVERGYGLVSGPRRSTDAGSASALAQSSDPTLVEPAPLRRRRTSSPR